MYRAYTRHMEAVTGAQTPCVPRSSRTRLTNAVRRVHNLYAAHKRCMGRTDAVRPMSVYRVASTAQIG